jgi:hypothetical protein
LDLSGRITGNCPMDGDAHKGHAAAICSPHAAAQRHSKPAQRWKHLTSREMQNSSSLLTSFLPPANAIAP